MFIPDLRTICAVHSAVPSHVIVAWKVFGNMRVYGHHALLVDDFLSTGLAEDGKLVFTDFPDEQTIPNARRLASLGKWLAVAEETGESTYGWEITRLYSHSALSELTKANG